MPATETAASQPAVQPKFELGRTVMTRGIHELVLTEQVDPLALLGRHVCGDWGSMSEPDKAQNDAALTPGQEERLMSSYAIRADLTVWIITEWDRAVTTLLLPSEY